ncbi:hypothetical protein K461DRAFT_295110 [Myriangium duriaei CBS 260.36]|uniref:Uncharacterized protein n=1 Tax=Myriangium duriaei CBS 260.36 TaxID=1168546 RepID=A0A9P4MKQ3_9PEZI|nr:hypothetical protein K461DRAFT_295110 [Myriangium duriaei CBS 260.36]
MEAAIRWARGPSPDTQRFLLVDVAGNSITLNESRTEQSGDLVSERIARYDKVPNFTAFDWSKSDTGLLALGLSSGDASLLSIDAEKHTISQLRLLPIRTQRKANSIAFNTGRLLAVGLDRVRNDHCLTVYDADAGKEAHTRLCTGEAVSSVRFFPNRPQEVVAAVARSTLRLYDLREPSFNSINSASTVFTKQVHNIAIDPMDDNYFASGGSTGDPTVSIWDKRWVSHSSSATPDGAGSLSVLDLKPAVDNTQTATVWSIRFSGLRRGRFAVLSSTGAVRLYDVAAHSINARSRIVPSANFYGGSPWSGPQYVSKTHDIQYPYYDKLHSHDESTRVIAFDWVTDGSAEGQSMLALRLTREVNMLHAPKPQLMQMTARDDLTMCRDDISIVQPRQVLETAAEEATEAKRVLENRIRPPRRSLSGHHSGRRSIDLRPLNAQTLEALRDPNAAMQRTQTWLQQGTVEPTISPVVKLDNFPDALALINVHRRRCQEGYRFDCLRNRQIVKDDPILDRLWYIISRLESLAANGGMTSETMDLSYFGVQGIWNGNLGEGRNRVLPGRGFSTSGFETSIQYLVKLHGLPTLEGLPAKTINKRLLSLELCGWCFSREGLEGKCMRLIEQRQFYRAVAVAFFQGHIDLSLNMLRNLTRQKIIMDNGLGALLASANISQDQRDMCRWMEEDALDPYLKSMLRYIADRDWRGIVDNSLLHLSDRLSVALRYLKDADMTSFITKTTAACIDAGDASGVLLTGLAETCVLLFQNYLIRTSDLQTVVLATSFTCPLYISDSRHALWKETYFDQLQAWRCFVERTKFSVEHAQRSVRRDGTKLIPPAPRQIGLRCTHCNASLARPAGEPGQKASMGFESPSPGASSTSSAPSSGKPQSSQVAARIADASGTVCPRCGRHLPRCAVCLQWLGTPELSTVAPRAKSRPQPVAVPAPATGGKPNPTEGKIAAAAQKTRELDTALSRFVTFCAGCGHGLHAHHARQWFAKHGMCPVPDCGCLCGVRR